ncbi:hypothetical protein GCM10009867_32560 [Pedococcus aerophilus]|uniref:YdbS-like PH domain-containing protein n=1 Tax=Pedococcus aerophilus TaxID=436356 RepID=A0ABN3UV64_9MICO
MPPTTSVAAAQTDPDRGSAPRHASVRLYDDAGLSWQPVSQRLATVRRVSLTVLLVPVLLVLVPLAVLAWSWFWLGATLAVGLGLWGWWLAGRQVSAISWIEGTEELVVRRGRLFRTVVSVPYGRLQYVDVQSGPLERRFDLATVELHTASPESGGQIPGLPTAEAERLRERLAARGESQRAGL